VQRGQTNGRYGACKAEFQSSDRSSKASSSALRCFLMSGSDDYIALVMARDIADFERVHRTLASLAYSRALLCAMWLIATFRPQFLFRNAP
jgi:DNA-binding Lrp family transcriptional regulator